VSATSARSEVIKLANKRNLIVLSAWIISASIFIAAQRPSAAAYHNQVPPGSEAAQEQREEKAPSDTIKWETSKIQAVFTIAASCSFTFDGKDGKQAVLDFCGEEVKYSGDLPMDESAELFFQYVVKRVVACQTRTKEKREE
jgi:hypothetical protein